MLSQLRFNSILTMEDKIQFLQHLRHKIANRKVGLLDCRSSAQFQLQHIKFSVNLPAAEVPLRVAELPLKSIPLILLGLKNDLHAVRMFLTERGYAILQVIEMDGNSDPFWQVLSENNLLEVGMSKEQLWQPNTFLKQQIALIEKKIVYKENKRVLDIACGSGREAVFLAKRRWQVSAVDHLPAAVERCRQFANFQKVKVDLHCHDVTNDNSIFAADAFDLVIMFRFLHRPLFPLIQKCLKPGGIFMGETFSTEGAKFSKPRRQSLLLKKNELTKFFNAWKIIIEHKRLLNDGRTMVGGIYQKPL